MGNFIFGGGSRSLNKGGLLTYRGRKALPLSFTLQPQAKTVDEYALATFSCEVTGGVAPYTYQWKKNAANVGTNSASLSFTAAAADKNASITVVVTDSVGTVITSTPAVLGVTSYVYQMDGVTQYAQLSSPIEISASDNFGLSGLIRIPAGSYGRIFGNGVNNQSSIAVYSDGSVLLRSESSDVIFLPSGSFTSFNQLVSWSVSRVSGVTSLSVGNASGSASGQTGTYAISQLGKQLSYGKQAISNIKRFSGGGVSTGTVTLEIPLNNKSQGANQLATVGSINATIINYNANGWVAI